MPAGFHKIPEIQKALKELEEEANRYAEWKHKFNNQYAEGIKHSIEKIREIIDSA